MQLGDIGNLLNSLQEENYDNTIKAIVDEMDKYMKDWEQFQTNENWLYTVIDEERFCQIF